MLLTRTYTGHPLGLIMALQDSEQWHHKSGRQYLLKLGVCHLRRNPPEVRVTSGQKPRTKIICIVLQLFCRALLNIFSKQFISSNTKHRKRMLNFVWNPWKFWWNENDDEILPVSTKSLNFEIIFSRPVGNCFRCYFRELFIYLALRKCKND